MSWGGVGYVLGRSWLCLGEELAMSWGGVGYVLAVLGNVLDVLCNVLGNVLVPWLCFYSLAMSWLLGYDLGASLRQPWGENVCGQLGASTGNHKRQTRGNINETKIVLDLLGCLCCLCCACCACSVPSVCSVCCVCACCACVCLFVPLCVSVCLCVSLCVSVCLCVLCVLRLCWGSLCFASLC
jgi:hypothetical protein